MSVHTAALWFSCFILYAFLGWVCETVYCSVLQKRFVERGFLRGPLCPIYGAGALAILWLLAPFVKNVVLIFALGAAVTSALEYATSFLMEKLFHMRWWDYSAHRFNIKGRVCLLNSTLFGLLCVVLTEGIHPLAAGLLAAVPPTALYCADSAVFAAFAADTVVSVVATVRLRDRLEKLIEAEEQLKLRFEAELAEKRERLEAEWTERKERFSEEMAERKERLDGELGERKEELRARLARLDRDGDGRVTLGELAKSSRERAAENRAALLALVREKAARLTAGERYLLRSFPSLRLSGRGGDAMARLRDALDHARKKKT
ncbi:MAG: putative ABC transporter permease [Bacillota bacterium]|jgi:uncharacterized membrane protein